MSYQSSKARQSFEFEIDSMISVIEDTFKNTTVTHGTKNHVLSSCVMLCFAKIEVYIEDLFESWIHKLNNSSPHLTSSMLPNNLKAFYFNQDFLLNAYKKLLIDKNEKKFLETMAAHINDTFFDITDPSKITPTLDAKKIYWSKKYPSPQNIDSLFFRIGIKNIFNELNKESRSDLEKSFISFHEVRTDIAHNGIPPGLNDNDIIDKLKGIKRFIEYMDTILFVFLTRHSRIDMWET